MNFDFDGVKKYGLQVKKPITSFQPDEEETVSQQIARQAQLNRARAISEAAKVLSSDPLAYAYDSKCIKKPKAEDRSVRYHEQIKEKVGQKKREQSIIKERMERKKLEGAEDEERFITPSYMKLLAENNELEKLLDSHDKAQEDKAAKAPLAFYSNLFKNRAFGSEEPAPTKRQKTDESLGSTADSAEGYVMPELVEEVQPKSESKIVDVPIVQRVVATETKEDKLAAARARYLARKTGS